MDTASYALTLQGQGGSICSATLQLAFGLKKEPHTAQSGRTSKAGEREWFYVYEMSGSLLAPDITGPKAVPLSGLVFVSEYGPPLSYLLQGSQGTATLSLQFNLIDSPGKFIGGGLGYFPQGGGSPVTPYGVLGVQT